MSRGLVEGRILETITVSSSIVIGLNGLNRETLVGKSTLRVHGGSIFDIISGILSKKNDRNISHSSFEVTGRGGGAGLTHLLIVPNKALGFFLLH